MIQADDFAHMLSFDVEEYFHCEVYRSVIAPQDRGKWPSRIDCQLDGLLEQLDSFGVRATFFILGQLAQQRPDIVKTIAAGGHEIACHGHCHEMIERLGPDGFRRDTAEGRDILQQITGIEVAGYRAATFGLVCKTAWAIDILAELGFSYDSSVQPVTHDRYGVADAPPVPHMAIGPVGGEILELPPMTARMAGRNIPLGGGGYFRLLPTVFFDRTLRSWHRNSTPAMLYLHPWEFDADQPRPPVGFLSKFRHRVNLSRTASKLAMLMERHKFSTVKSQLPRLFTAAVNRNFEYAKYREADKC